MPYVFRDPCNVHRRLISFPTESAWNSLLNYWAETYPFPDYTPEPNPGIDRPTDGSAQYRREYQTMLQIAQQYLGYSYSWGGKTPPYFDCSGFVAYCYKQAGIFDSGVVAYTGALIQECTKVSDASSRPGDLCFWSGNSGDANSGNAHVGIYIGNGKVLDDSGSGVAYRDVTWHPASRFMGYYRPNKWI